jgi:primosomal protein N' (replication factor Y)
MCPETHEAQDIRLYKCVEFPLKWQYVKSLITNVSAVDTSIFFKNEKWWLMTNLSNSLIKDMKVFRVLLPNIFNHPFTYESDINLKVGDYVVVPFGKSKITGVVWDEFEKKNNRNFKIKNVLKKLDVVPLKKTTIKFLNWFSEYNIIPKGMALKLVLLSSNAVEKIQKDAYKIFETNIKKNSIKLSEEQKKSLKKMNVSNQKFRVHVLQGTTGSGKLWFILKLLKPL